MVESMMKNVINTVLLFGLITCLVFISYQSSTYNEYAFDDILAILNNKDVNIDSDGRDPVKRQFNININNDDNNKRGGSDSGVDAQGGSYTSIWVHEMVLRMEDSHKYSAVPSLTPSSEPLAPSTMEVSISTITIVIVLLLVVVIVVSSTLLVLYFYNMRVKRLKEKRIHVYETEEEHHDETDNRINNAVVISPEDIPITAMEDEEDEPDSSLAMQHDDSFMYLCDKVEANEMAMESSIDFIKIRMMKMN